MVSKIEQLLIDGLELSNASVGTGAMVFILLQKESQQLEMCRFMKSNREATDEEIIAMARKISGYKD